MGPIKRYTMRLLINHINTKGIGERLPNDHVMSVLLGVSRHLYKECVFILAWEGYLSLQHGRPTKIVRHVGDNDDIWRKMGELFARVIYQLVGADNS